jgi:hypothetical protein
MKTRLLPIDALVTVGLICTPFAAEAQTQKTLDNEDPVVGAKKACDGFGALAAKSTTDQLVNGFYTENAMYIGPTLPGGMVIGREAIRKSYAESPADVTFKGVCEHAQKLSETVVAISGHWTTTPNDPLKGEGSKGSFALIFVKEDGKWLTAVDSWNIELPAPPAKAQ